MKTHLSSTFGNNLADKSQQFQLETQYGHTIQLLVNQQTQQPIIVLKNKRGQIISRAQLDIQLNTKRLQGVEIEQVAYDSETKKLLFIFADESTTQASIQALWDELEQTVIGQLALLKNILTEQHADLSSMAAAYSQSLLIQVAANNERSTTLVKEDLAQRTASLAETLALLADAQNQNHRGTLSTLNQKTSQLLGELAVLESQLAAAKTQEGQNTQSLASMLSVISQAIEIVNGLLAAAAAEREELKDLIDTKSGEILGDTAALAQTASDIATKIGSASDTLDIETLFGRIAKLHSQLAAGQSDLDASLTGELAAACESLEAYLSTQILSPIQIDLQTASTSRAEALGDLQTRLTTLSASIGSAADAENSSSGLYKQLAEIAKQITALAADTSDTNALQRIEGKLPQLATTEKLEEAQTTLLNTIGDFSSLDQTTLVALLTAILAQVKEKSTNALSSELATFGTDLNGKLGFDGGEDTAKAAIQAIVSKLGFDGNTDTAKAAIQDVIGKLGLTDEQTVSELLESKVADLRGDNTSTLAQISTAIAGLANGDSLDALKMSIQQHTTTKSSELATTVQDALTSAVATIQGGTQGQTKQTLANVGANVGTLDSRLEFIVTMLANKPTLSIEGTVPTYYLVGTNTAIPVQAKSSRILKADETLTVLLKTSSGTAEKGNTTTTSNVSYTTAAADTANLTITATLTKTNPYDSDEKFVIATASKTVYRAYKVYYGYADTAPTSVDTLADIDVYSTHGTCNIPANPDVGGKYLYIFVPNTFGETASKLSISSSGFTYNWRVASTIDGYYMYKSANPLNSHDKISLIQ